MRVALAIPKSTTAVILLSLSVLLVVVALFALTIGAVTIPFGDVSVIVLRKLGLLSSTEVDGIHEVVINSIRIPRILMTMLVGGALGISGAALQGLFRNPLVEPGLIGVSGGSAAAVVLVIVFGATLALPATGLVHDSILSASSFIGGIVVTIIVLRLSTLRGKTSISAMILVGVALNAFAGALIGLSIFYADENQLRTFTFWTLGDLGGATNQKLLIAAPILILSSIVLSSFSRNLNAIAMGEAEAYHLGVNVEFTKKMIIIFSALAVGVSVSLAGMIGFVGLIIPHLIRVLFQSDNKIVLPASFLGGAILLLAADIIARTIVQPAELPIGIVTALLGAPFFIMLLVQAKNKNTI